ncbi:MAG: tetratricopeptide repeat protein [Calditrichaeota bacterium]|nr:MAG: tetratricopeptide repeat protein [Calditrichota bacterium]
MNKYVLRVAGVLFILMASVLMSCQPKEVTSAKVYINQNDWDNAIKQLEAAVKAYPENAEAHYLLGRGYGMKGQFDKMNQEFDASLAIAPTFQKQIEFERNKYWVENYNRGVRQFNEQKFEEAEKSFLTAISVNPKRVEAYRNLAVAYVREKRFDDAVNYFKKALEIEPNSVETLNNLGTVYYQMKKYEDAARVLEKVMELDPSNSQAISTLGLAYHLMGQTDKAIAAYEKALEKNPSNADLLFNYAALLLKRGEFEKAAQKFQQVLEKNPNDYDAVVSVADAFLQVAEKFTKDANKLETEDEKGNEEKIKEYRKAANEFYRKAVPYLEKATELKPDSRNVWFNLGVAYVHLGEKAKGEAAFKKADELEKAQKQ